MRGEVPNHAMALLLACAKKLTILNDIVKRGRWSDTRGIMPPMAPVHGQTLGLVGCGNIGRMVAEKAALGLKVIGYDPFADKTLVKKAGIVQKATMAEVLKEADFVSIHAFLDEKTRHMIGEKEFRQMKPTAYFINTARGPIVDEQALIKALQEKRIAGAGLDVFEKEPETQSTPCAIWTTSLCCPTPLLTPTRRGSPVQKPLAGSGRTSAASGPTIRSIQKKTEGETGEIKVRCRVGESRFRTPPTVYITELLVGLASLRPPYETSLVLLSPLTGEMKARPVLAEWVRGMI